MAKHHGQDNVEAELRRLLETGETIDPKAIESKVDTTSPASLVKDPHVEQPELDQYDDLLEHKEVLDEPDKHTDNGAIETATEPRGTGWPFETTETTDDAIHGDQLSGSSIARELESSSVFGCAVDCRDGQADRESHIAPHEAIGTGMHQDMVSDQVVAIPDGGATSNATTSKRGVREALGELVDIWQTGFGEDHVTESVGRPTGASRSYSVLRTMCETGATSTACQARTSTTADAEVAWPNLSVDHRRHRVCTTESRRDGSIVYINCGSIRANEYVDQQQPSIFKMGADLQGRDDHSSGHRPIGAPQHDHRAQREQLSIGGSPGKTASNDYVGALGDATFRVEIDQNLVGKFSCR